MSQAERPQANPYAEMDEDTAETSLAGRFFLWRWYKRTTRGFGLSRPFFMPLGFLALSALAFFLGFGALEELVDDLLLGIHRGIAAASGLLGDQAQTVFDLQTRRMAAPVFALGWAVLASVSLALGALPPKETDPGLGYVVPGSGLLARSWAVIGKRLYQLKRAVVYLLAYLRDLNLQKIHQPLSVLLLLALAYGGLARALENLLWELPARAAGLAEATGWIRPGARIAAAVVVWVLGIPMLVNSVQRAHGRSVKLRTKDKVGFVRRRLKGAFGLLFVFAPLVWMVMRAIGAGAASGPGT